MAFHATIFIASQVPGVVRRRQGWADGRRPDQRNAVFQCVSKVGNPSIVGAAASSAGHQYALAEVAIRNGPPFGAVNNTASEQSADRLGVRAEPHD